MNNELKKALRSLSALDRAYTRAGRVIERLKNAPKHWKTKKAIKAYQSGQADVLDDIMVCEAKIEGLIENDLKKRQKRGK